MRAVMAACATQLSRFIGSIPEQFVFARCPLVKGAVLFGWLKILVAVEAIRFVDPGAAANNVGHGILCRWLQPGDQDISPVVALLLFTLEQGQGMVGQVTVTVGAVQFQAMVHAPEGPGGPILSGRMAGGAGRCPLSGQKVCVKAMDGRGHIQLLPIAG